MLRILISLILITSCSMGTVKTGGDRSYVYDAKRDYSSEELKELSSKIVETSRRDPQAARLDDLFGKNQKPLKRIGILIFESQIQPTWEGLAGKNEIYLSEQGKQLLTEKYLSIWEQSLKVLAESVEVVPTSKIKKSPSFHQYGSAEDDFIKARRTSIAPDDIFFLESGKKTTATTLLNPRGMRDMSFVLVPAYDMVGGPKWSEHHKHFINDVSKNLNLDAVLIVMSETSWSTAHTDKHSGEVFPEEIKIKVKATTLVPLHQFHKRLEVLNKSDKPGLTLSYRAYESMLKIPATISFPKEEKTFETIESELLNPMLKTYKDLSQMTIMRVIDDFKKTW